MKEVKEEVFGSRNSILEEQFLKNGITFFKNFWFVTCRSAINSNKQTRYLVLIENDNPIKLSLFKSTIPVYRIKFKGTVIELKNLRDNKVLSFYEKDELRNWIVELTRCQFIHSYASGSSLSTSLSIFFRENMGKGFALSDIDFLLTEKEVLIEEKTFIQNNKGYLGQGQCFTFKEIVNDICNNLPLDIILSSNDEFYKVNLSNITCSNTKSITNWGTMVEFDLGTKYTIKQIIDLYR
jgi:hypothetical protein